MGKTVFWGEEYLGWLSGCLLGFLILGIAGAVACLMPPRPNSESSTKLWTLSGAVASLLFARLWMSWKTRHWLTANDSGFVYSHCGATYHISDEDVTDVGIAEKVARLPTTSFVHRSVRFAFQTSNETKVLTFEQETSSDQTDAFGLALARAVERIAARVLKRIHEGDEESGDGWALSRRELTISCDSVSATVRIHEITAIDWVDNTVCVWVAGDAKPLLRREATKRGATVLYWVLKELVAKQASATPKPTPPPASSREATHLREDSYVTDSGKPHPTAAVVSSSPDSVAADAELGRLIFEREAGATRQAMRSHVVWLLISAPFGLIWFLAGLAGLGGPKEDKALLGLFLGPAVILMAVLPLFLNWLRTGRVFRCYEKGVVYKEGTRTRTLLFRDVSSFTYSGVRKYLEGGGYISTSVILNFEPLNPKKKPIEYAGESQYTDDELDRLRDHISGVIAGHMLRRLSEGGSVRWTPHWTFLSDGLFVRRDGKWKGATGVPIPYNQFARHEFKDGVFFLHPKMGFGDVIEEKVAVPNFFPGYFLLLLLISSNLAKPPAPPGTQPETPLGEWT